MAQGDSPAVATLADARTAVQPPALGHVHGRPAGQDPADLDGMIKRYPNAEKITLVGDVLSSRVLEKIKQEMPNIKHIVVRHEQPRRDEALAAVEHLPKQGPLDHDVATLAQSRPQERDIERARTLADLAALFPEPVGHPKHVQIEVPVPPVPALPTRRILDF